MPCQRRDAPIIEMGVGTMAQVSTQRGRSGVHVWGKAHALARRAGLSPVAKAGAAGIAVIALLAVLACARLLPGMPADSFAIERGEAIASVEAVENETTSEGERDNHAKAPADDSAESLPTIVVHVDGMVEAPGVYQLQGESLRVNDAVEAAGGLAEGADTSRLNLAEAVSDGEKVHVPAVGEESANPSGMGSSSASPDGAGSVSFDAGIVNINTATAAELTALPGVGDATAAEIIRDREANGAFTSVEDLMRVSGIGEKKFAKLKDRIRV